MHIWLLTHPEEFKKQNGTRKLVIQTLPHLTTALTWQRTAPSVELTGLPVERTLLIYPESDLTLVSTECSNDATQQTIEHIILIDGTWQQARKIYNRSPYLHRFKKFEIKGQQSIFTRRRNQIKNGLCTAESVIYLLKTFSPEMSEANKLEETFLTFNQQTLHHN